MATSLDAALDEAASACDKLVAELDERIDNGKTSGGEHPTEEQIAGIVREYVNDARLRSLEAQIEGAVRERMKAKGWTYNPTPKK